MLRVILSIVYTVNLTAIQAYPIRNAMLSLKRGEKIQCCVNLVIFADLFYDVRVEKSLSYRSLSH